MKAYTTIPLACFIGGRVPSLQHTVHRFYSEDGIFEEDNGTFYEHGATREPLDHFKSLVFQQDSREQCFTVPFPHICETVETSHYSLRGGVSLVVESVQGTVNDYYFVGEKPLVIKFLNAFT